MATKMKPEYQVNGVLTEFLWAQLFGVIMPPPATSSGSEASAHCLFLFPETHCFALPEALASIHTHSLPQALLVHSPNGSSPVCKQFRVNARNTGEHSEQ